MAVIVERATAATDRTGLERALPVAVALAAALVVVGWVTGSLLWGAALGGLLVVGTTLAEMEHRSLRLAEVTGLGVLHLVALLAI